MKFLQYLSVMQALAKSEGGATVGQVLRVNPHLTRGQGERILKSLVSEGLVIVEFVAYRSNINKRVYHLDARAVEYCECIVNDFDNSLHQRSYLK